jgi:small GTP-binding protein
VCMLGAWGVGKTSLVRRFVNSMFSDSYLTSVGVKIDKKVVTIGSETLTMMLWDMAGEEEGVPLRLDRLRDASAAVLVADGCRSGSLDTALNLHERILAEVGPITTVLAVNKVDLFDEWDVSLKTLELYAATELVVFTTSAKTGKGVEQMFRQIARDLLSIHR